jgi:hypothetical protein
MLFPLQEGKREPIGTVDGKTYFRCGTTGDGNCMFHAWILAMSKETTREKAMMFRHDTIKMLKSDKEFQESLVYGIKEPEVYKQALEADLGVRGSSIADILAYELQKDSRFASADILPAIAEKCNVDLYLLSDNGSKLQTQHHRNTNGKRYAVILLNLGNYHYEYVVNEQWQTPHHPNDPFVRKLYQLLLKQRSEDTK